MQPSVAECEDFHWTSAVDKLATQCFAESAPMHFVPCHFNPAVLSLLLQHIPSAHLVVLWMGCPALLWEKYHTSDVKWCCRKAQGEIRSISVFGKAESTGIPKQKIVHPMVSHALCQSYTTFLDALFHEHLGCLCVKPFHHIIKKSQNCLGQKGPLKVIQFNPPCSE